jgi:hypothetical protein
MPPETTQATQATAATETAEPTEARIAAAIEALLRSRAADRSACPSEVARALAPEHWRPLMPRVRRVAATMALHGQLMLSQRGVAVDPRQVLDGTLRGPLRLRRALPPSAPSVKAGAEAPAAQRRAPA